MGIVMCPWSYFLLLLRDISITCRPSLYPKSSHLHPKGPHLTPMVLTAPQRPSLLRPGFRSRIPSSRGCPPRGCAPLSAGEGEGDGGWTVMLGLVCMKWGLASPSEGVG